MSDTPETNAAAFDAFDGQGGEVVFADFAKKLERERNSLQDQRDFCMGEIERLRKKRDEAREEVSLHEAKREREEIAALVRRLFGLLETVEVSDSEREFHPTYISSCRVAHTMELDKLLPKLKEAAK